MFFSLPVFKMSTMPNQPYMYYQQVVLMLMQVVVSASHNEAFVSYRDLLRSYKYHLTEINKQFPKTYTKNGPGNAIAGNPIKPRQVSFVQQRTEMHCVTFPFFSTDPSRRPNRTSNVATTINRIAEIPIRISWRRNHFRFVAATASRASHRTETHHTIIRRRPATTRVPRIRTSIAAAAFNTAVITTLTTTAIR